MDQLPRRSLLSAGAIIAGAAGLSGCGLFGPSQPLTKGTPTPKGSLLAPDFFYAGDAAYAFDGFGTPSTTVFRTPHFGMQLKQFGVLDKLTSTQATDVELENDYSGYRVPAGHEVVYAQLRAGKPSFADDGSTAYAVRVDGNRHDLQPPFGSYNDKDEKYQASSLTIVACVAQGRPVTFEVTDAGKTATLDLRTGQPVKDSGTDAMAVLNSAAAVSFAQKRYDFRLAFTTAPDDGSPAEAGSVSLQYDLQRGALLAWLPDAGWATDGRCYLQLQLDITSPIVDGQDMSLALADMFRLTSAGGLR